MSWDRILGHDLIREQFQAAVQRNRLGHAYLFAGPEGVGKKLFARELTKTLLCERNAGAFLCCDHCPTCMQIEATTHPDFLVVQKPEDKMEMPIDTIREFCANLGRKPTRSSRKIAIIEDADDFNNESANALLKSLEEPPPGSLLILLSTSPESQLSTIRSRCQMISFRPLPIEAVRQVLSRHNISDPIRLERLARQASGSVGRALALNDEAYWAFRSELLEKLAASRFSPAGFVSFWANFIESLGKDAPAQRLRGSLSIQILGNLLVHTLRVQLGDSLPEEGREGRALQSIAQRWDTEELLEIIDLSIEGEYQIERRVPTVLVVERIAARIAQLSA